MSFDGESTQLVDTVQEAIVEHATHNTKFVDADVTVALAGAAKDWIASYTGNFEYVQSMKLRMPKYGLSTSQVRGALNCMVAEAKREIQAQQPQPEEVPAAKPSTTTVVPDGIYTVVFGDEHRTIRFRHGRGDSKDVQFISYLFGNNNDSDYKCCALVSDGSFRWTRAFQQMPEQTLVRQAVDLMVNSTDEQRGEAGRAYAMQSGNCYICNKTLTDPISIATGVGPVCRDKHGIPEVQPSPTTAALNDIDSDSEFNRVEATSGH